MMEWEGPKICHEFSFINSSLVIDRGRILIPILIPIPMASVAMLGEPYLVDYLATPLVREAN